MHVLNVMRTMKNRSGRRGTVDFLVSIGFTALGAERLIASPLSEEGWKDYAANRYDRRGSYAVAVVSQSGGVLTFKAGLVETFKEDCALLSPRWPAHWRPHNTILEAHIPVSLLPDLAPFTEAEARATRKSVPIDTDEMTLTAHSSTFKIPPVWMTLEAREAARRKDPRFR